MDFKTKKQDVHSAKFFFKGTAGAFIVLTTFPDEAIRELRREFSSEIIDYPAHPKTGLMQRVVTPQFDNKAFIEKMLDISIVEWGGWSVDGSEDLECNYDNKIMLTETFTEFATFYTRSVKKLTAEFKKKYGSKSARKNSRTTRRTT